MPLVLAASAMGTRFELVLDGLDEPALRAAGEAALAEIARIESLLSAFRTDSALSDLNRRGAAGWVRIDPELLAVLAVAKRIGEETAGAFDPGVGRLLEAWGLRGAVGAAPSAADVARARASGGIDALRLDPTRGAARFERAGLALDLGGIGKGYALDRAAEILEEAGVVRALLHGGTSTVRAIGAPPGRAGWRIGIPDPRRPGRVLAHADLAGGALAVSAPSGRYGMAGDRRVPHVLDPRTGEPAEGTSLVAVRHAEAAVADAYSTAALAGGPAVIEAAGRAGLPLDFLWIGAGPADGPRRAGADPHAFVLGDGEDPG